jgi:hypothetical protein
MIKAQFSGKSEAKGRNGIFVMDTADVFSVTPTTEETWDTILGIRSKRIGNGDPIALYATLDDIKVLHAMLSDYITERRSCLKRTPSLKENLNVNHR